MDDSRTGIKNHFKKSDKYLILFLIVSLLLVNAVLNFIFGQPYKKYAKFNINNISTYVWNNGEMDINPDGNAAFEFPINNKRHLFYASGFLWGGIINGQIYVNGTTYSSGVLPGRILPNGTADNEDDEKNRVYKVSSTFQHYEDDLSLNKENKSRDWKEWPAKWGAPFYDKNKNGLYEPEIDIPGKKGAHQTLWFVTNDLNTENTNSIFIKRPMGLEIQTTIWGYNNISELSNIIFKELKIINKSGKDITEFYSAIWTDSDIGNATDDFSGCDTTLNLGYSFNGTDEDKVYNKLVPAAGYCYLEDNINGSNRIYENINAFVCEFPRYNYSHGHFDFYWFEYYQYFKGRIGTTGEIFVDPNTGKNTKYVMAGDPINRIGWIDGQLFPPGDRKHLLSVGPYNLKANDTLTVVFAQLAALGKDRLESVRALKKYAKYLQEIYPNFEEEIHGGIVPVMPGLTYASEEYGAVKINWDKEAESYSQNGYEFQGYNVYQFYKDFKINTDPIKVAVFDKVDGITRISGEKTEPTTGNRYVGLIQEGSDSGIKNRISINKDYTIGTSLKEGEEYYFGVSAYYYNKEKNKSVESGINKFKVTVNQEDDTKLPEKYTLSQNYPNPFNPNTKIKFTIPYAGDEFRRHGQYASPSFAAIKIYDVLGREVKTLLNEAINEGEHEVEFNASNMPSGIYFYTLQVNSKIIDSKKMVLLK